MSDEYDEKLFRVRTPRGQHLDRSLDTPGAYRGTLRDGENRLAGHAEMFEVDEYGEDDEEAGLGALLGLIGVAAISYGTYKVVSNARETKALQRQDRATQREERRARRREVRTLSQDVRALRRKERARKKETARQIESAPAAEALPAQTSVRVLPPAGWYEVDSSRLRWWDGQDWTDHFSRIESNRVASPSEPTGSSQLEPSMPNGHSHRAGPTMSRAEWTERARAMLLARAFSEEQWQLLSNARIEDADALTIECQRELRSLTPQEFSARINVMLDSNPDLFAGAPALPAAGWYDDGTGSFRWWDSLRWTEHTQPVPARAMVAAQPGAGPGWYDDGSGRMRWWTGQQWQ